MSRKNDVNIHRSDFKGTVVNQTWQFLNRGSLKVTLTVSLRKIIIKKDLFIENTFLGLFRTLKILKKDELIIWSLCMIVDH